MHRVLQSFAATAVVQILNIFSGILAARFLLPEGRGELAAVFLWPVFIGSVISLSLDRAVSYYSASEPLASRRFFASACLVTAPLSASAVAVGYFAIPWIMRSYGPDVVALSQLFMFIAPVQHVSMIALGGLQGQQRFGQWNLVRALPAVAYVVAIFLFVTYGEATVGAFALAFFAGSVVTAVTGLCLILGDNASAWVPYRRDIEKIAQYGAGAHLASLAGIANQHVDRIFAVFYLEPALLGLYVVATSAAGIIATTGRTFGQLAFARTAKEQSIAGKFRVFGRFFRATLFSVVALTTLLVLVGGWLVAAMFGEPFGQASGFLPVLVVGTATHTLKTNLYDGLRASARLRSISIAEYSSLCVRTAALILLLPMFGVLGAAWAVVLSGLVGLSIAAMSTKSWAGTSVLSLACPTQDDLAYLRNFSREFLHGRFHPARQASR